MYGCQAAILFASNTTVIKMRSCASIRFILNIVFSYMCQLCQCGDPSNAFTVTENNFPNGVKILSYIYEEALFCTESTDHLVLLYLLRKCCSPYLKFVQVRYVVARFC